MTARPRFISGSTYAGPENPDEDMIVEGKVGNGRIEYMAVGINHNQVPDLIRLQPEGGWRPSIYRKPEESGGSFWDRVVAAAIELRKEKVRYEPYKLIMYCYYGVPYVDEDTAFRSDTMNAMKAGLRSAMDNPDATPQVRLQATWMMAKLIWPELKG